MQKRVKPIKLITILIILSYSNLLAKEKNIKTIELIDIAGKQRMLSQRIAKDYLYIHKQIAVNKTEKELKASLDIFFKAQKTLIYSIEDEEIKNLLDFVEISSDELNKTIHKPFSIENAQLILDLTESILEGSQYIVDSLKNSIKKEESRIIEISGKQRMLSQRIAKYYIAYQSGIKDKNTLRSMKKTLNEFDKNLNRLLLNKSNTPLIKDKVDNINRLWKIAYRFYKNIEKGGLPLIVFNTTDKITKKMNEITELYIKNNNKS